MTKAGVRGTGVSLACGLGILALTVCAAREAAHAEDSGAASPQLSAILRDWAGRLERNEASAADFWQMVERRGAPLVETLPGDDRFAAVTFLYRGDAATKSVTVIALENHQLANDRYFALGRLARLGSTDIWFRAYRLRADARFTYRLSVNDDRLFADLPAADWPQRLAALTRDPLNRHPATTRDGEVSLVELPAAPRQRWCETNPGVPAGRLEPARLGDRARGLDRDVVVYTPPGVLSATRPENLLIVLDGEGVPATMPVPTILDNLHAAGAIDSTITVMVSNRPGKRIADLWYSDVLVSFVRDDLVPWMRARYRAPSDPRHVVVAGRSASGNTAVYLAFTLPDLIGNAISQSGGYALGAPGQGAVLPAADGAGLTEDDFPQKEWLTRLIATTPRRPIRIHLEVGTLEDVMWESAFPQYATPTVLLANRHLRDVLDAKGYASTYREYNGPHDSLVWRGTLGDDLIAMIGRPPAPRK